MPRWLSSAEQRFRKLEDSIDWRSFRESLSKKYCKSHVNCVMSYALKYHRCLLEGNFSELFGFSVSKRRHILTAFSNLAKFLGVYEDFKGLVKAYGLKWETVKAEDLLISRINKTSENGEVLKWVLDAKTKFPHLDAFIDLLLVSELRFIEAVNSYNLIIGLAEEGKLESYYNAETETLEHFRFKKVFLRNTKKVFISFIPKELVEKVSKQRRLTVFRIRNPLKRSDLGLRFGDIREYFATYMTRWLNVAEIDFLQGRVSASVFMKHYFNPALLGDLKTRVFKGIASLKVLE